MSIPCVLHSVEVLRRSGRHVTAGAIGGPVVELDLRTLYLNDLELYGATVFEPGLFANLIVGELDHHEGDLIVGELTVSSQDGQAFQLRLGD